MRRRINSASLFHAEPEASKSFMTYRGKLEAALHKGNITQENLKELASLRVESRKPTLTITGEARLDIPTKEGRFVTLRIWGKEVKVSAAEYAAHKAALKVK